MPFSLSELSTLIRLVEKEDLKLHKEIESDDLEVSDDAADFSVHVGLIAGKLEELYKKEWSEDSNHSSYEEIIEESNK